MQTALDMYCNLMANKNTNNSTCALCVIASRGREEAAAAHLHSIHSIVPISNASGYFFVVASTHFFSASDHPEVHTHSKSTNTNHPHFRPPFFQIITLYIHQLAPHRSLLLLASHHFYQSNSWRILFFLLLPFLLFHLSVHVLSLHSFQHIVACPIAAAVSPAHPLARETTTWTCRRPYTNLHPPSSPSLHAFAFRFSHHRKSLDGVVGRPGHHQQDQQQQKH